MDEKIEKFTIYYSKNEYVILYYINYEYHSKLIRKEIYSRRILNEYLRYRSYYIGETVNYYILKECDLSPLEDLDILKYLKIINIKKFILDTTGVKIKYVDLFPFFNQKEQHNKLIKSIKILCKANNNYYSPNKFNRYLRRVFKNIEHIIFKIIK